MGTKSYLFEKIVEQFSIIRCSLLLLICVPCLMNAQGTMLYKRVMVVREGVKTVKNDDAHYITFTKKGCYDSDKRGIATSGNFINFTKDEKNLHCFYGRSYWGYAYYYFSNNYSRLNITTQKGITHVYQREMNGKTTAKWRIEKEKEGGSDFTIPNQSSSYNVPTMGIENSRNSSTSSSSKCKYCGGGGGCNSCKGTGHKFNVYSGHEDSCPSCHGSGKCQICLGTGRL